jgi:hypothetical protein
MKYLCIVLLFLSWPLYARELNFIESHLLRLSAQQNPTQWLLPFSQTRNPTPYEVNVFGSVGPDTYGLYSDLTSKNQAKIQKRLDDSYGQPYDISAKVNFGYRHERFSQFMSTNGGAVLLVTDPVFPELKGFLFHDYTATSSYIFYPTKRFMLKPQLSYGVRRILDREYTSGDLVEKGLDVKFNKAPYVGFAELNLLGVFSLSQWGSLLFTLSSLPVVKRTYEYWDTFVGYRTPSIAGKKSGWLNSWNFYGGYSPVYAGNYDVDRTVKIGTNLSLLRNIHLDIFTIDQFYPAAILSYDARFVSLELLTLERAYDDFGRQKARQYGANLKIKW